MGVISGMGGSVDGHDTVRQWQINHSADNQEFRASNTRGGTGRKGGNEDWTGSFTFFGTNPGVFPGETFQFQGRGAENASGQAIVESVEIQAQIEEGGIIQGTVNFAADGELTREAGSGDDESVPDPASAVNAKAEFQSAELEDVRSWSMTISANNRAYRSSSTNGHTRRVKGPIDVEASIDLYTDDLTQLPEPKLVSELKLFIDDTDSWDLEWMMVSSVEPTIDPESGDPVSATLNFEFTGFNEGAVGSITAPGAVDASWP